MNCIHEQLRCTDGVFYCLKCGAIVPNPYKLGNQGKGRSARRSPEKARKTQSENSLMKQPP